MASVTKKRIIGSEPVLPNLLRNGNWPMGIAGNCYASLLERSAILARAGLCALLWIVELTMLCALFQIAWQHCFYLESIQAFEYRRKGVR